VCTLAQEEVLTRATQPSYQVLHTSNFGTLANTPTGIKFQSCTLEDLRTSYAQSLLPLRSSTSLMRMSECVFDDDYELQAPYTYMQPTWVYMGVCSPMADPQNH